jgi:DNA-binding response OmpR family regulator
VSFSKIMVDRLPLAGKSVLIVEDEPLIAMSVEASLEDAGAACIKIASSVTLARSAIEEGTPFDAAIVDLQLGDGDAGPLIEILSGRRIPVVVATGGSIDHQDPDLSKAVAVLQKPYSYSELIKVMTGLTGAES